MARFSYSRWDGTQVGFDIGADDVFSELTDELAYHGDPNQALQRLMQRGFTDRNGDRVAGMREMLERLRQRRRQLLERHDLGGAYEDIAERLRDVVDRERDGIDALEREARESGDERRRQVTEETAAEKRMNLDLLPPDLAGQVQSLQSYEWTSSDARERFEALMDELRSELMQGMFNQMSEAMSDVSPEALQRSKDMFNDLNRMIEARAAGADTDRMFAEFMENYGDMFAGSPSTLDELLEMMAAQMAAMSQMLASMSPEQRAQLQALSESLMEDMDLRWQVERLGANLRNALPQMGWDQSRPFEGTDPLGFAQAGSVMGELSDMDQLENLLSSGTSPGALADVDLERAGEILGADDSRSLEAMARVARQLKEAGLIDQREGRMELTPRGLRRIGQNALSDLFSRLVKDRMGRHVVERVGIGHERTYETKAYEWGDPFNLSIERTVRNALRRAGPGTPVRLSPEDFEVDRTETMTSTSTVVALDLSLSMPMGDNFLAAKKVAIALQSLITTQYPRDFLGLVGFGEVARELRPASLPEVSWDYTYGTNMQHALILARRMLAHQHGTKQIIMITDGEPTAHLVPGSDRAYFSYPPSPETVRLTLAEVARATRESITINTFMLGATGYLREFVERMTQMNRGRAFFTTPETLGDYVLVDFLDQKRTTRGGRRTA
ncbi:MAG: VWA domain-containing protein [Actinomycetota bacterium]|nr:VWA domain-containing protein [Actinomycetota bacterium]